MRYFTNGKLDDDKFTGLTLSFFGSGFSQRNADGSENLGYMAKEITKDEYDIWLTRLANPDNVNYFHGIFGNGLLNAQTHQKMTETIEKAKIARLSVKRVQALIALAKAGITKDDIYKALGDDEIAKIWFEESLTFNRSNEYVKKIGVGLELTDAQLDDLFLEANKI